MQATTSIAAAGGTRRGGVTYGEMSKTTGTTSRLAWLDALRGFAALCVVFDHGSTLLVLPARDFLYQWFNFGEYGVFVFFLVSGYIVPASLERKGSLRSFWTSRGFRLYPMYAAAIAAAAIAYWNRFGTIRGAEHHPLTSVMSWLLMLPNLLTGPNVPNVRRRRRYRLGEYRRYGGAEADAERPLHQRAAVELGDGVHGGPRRSRFIPRRRRSRRLLTRI